ncbi:hypothetical protein RchiOBHm_Chr7g0227811 [Rosa chinensis]|uniref:Uncharacterized protein n=1 Tax=Rosa chinensis TaxID=74649 RepID=A0A2P6PEQ4_ROSCH|nr:hypothetical protein RchiOBHm_Chr7g0227811 [Rosa chinensis]
MFWIVLCKGDSQLVFLPLVFAVGFVFHCYSAMWYESEFFLHNSVLLASLSIFVGE